MLISIHDQHEYIACLYLKPNLIAINQSKSAIMECFSHQRTILNTHCSLQCKQNVAS